MNLAILYKHSLTHLLQSVLSILSEMHLRVSRFMTAFGNFGSLINITKAEYVWVAQSFDVRATASLSLGYTDNCFYINVTSDDVFKTITDVNFTLVSGYTKMARRAAKNAIRSVRTAVTDLPEPTARVAGTCVMAHTASTNVLIYDTHQITRLASHVTATV